MRKKNGGFVLFLVLFVFCLASTATATSQHFPFWDTMWRTTHTQKKKKKKKKRQTMAREGMVAAGWWHEQAHKYRGTEWACDVGSCLSAHPLLAPRRGSGFLTITATTHLPKQNRAILFASVDMEGRRQHREREEGDRGTVWVEWG